MTNDDRSDTEGIADWQAIARYLAKESGGETRSRFERSLADAPARAELVHALGQLLEATRPEPLPPRVVEEALSRVKAQRDAEVHTAWRAHAGARRWGRGAPIASRRYWSAAAAILVVIGLSAVLWQRARQSPDRSEIAHVTPPARIDTLWLADGSRVVLAPSSELTVTFGRERRATLRGEALFDVVHDSAHPFVVRSGAVELRDVGTSFTVRARGGDVHVAVLQGAVALAAPASRGDTLQRGDVADVTATGVSLRRGGVSDADLAFTRGALVLRDVPLADALAEWSRARGGAPLRADPRLATRRVTVTFTRETAREAADVLAALLGGATRRQGDTLLIVPAPR